LSYTVSERADVTVWATSFLGYVDLLGTTYSASTLATGYGAHIAQPLLRAAVEGKEDTLTEDQAKEIIETCMKVLFYRDARSLNKVDYYILQHVASMTNRCYHSIKSRLLPRKAPISPNRGPLRLSGHLRKVLEATGLRHNDVFLVVLGLAILISLT
jgi:hypothetical protein